jgi:hypothetical protein
MKSKDPNQNQEMENAPGTPQQRYWVDSVVGDIELTSLTKRGAVSGRPWIYCVGECNSNTIVGMQVLLKSLNNRQLLGWVKKIIKLYAHKTEVR